MEIRIKGAPDYSILWQQRHLSPPRTKKNCISTFRKKMTMRTKVHCVNTDLSGKRSQNGTQKCRFSRPGKQPVHSGWAAACYDAQACGLQWQHKGLIVCIQGITDAANWNDCHTRYWLHSGVHTQHWKWFSTTFQDLLRAFSRTFQDHLCLFSTMPQDSLIKWLSNMSDVRTHLLNAARGPGECLISPQRVLAEPGRQTGFAVHGSKMWQPVGWFSADFPWPRPDSTTSQAGKICGTFHDLYAPGIFGCEKIPDWRLIYSDITSAGSSETMTDGQRRRLLLDDNDDDDY